jgi:hypothetical protein
MFRWFAVVALSLLPALAVAQPPTAQPPTAQPPAAQPVTAGTIRFNWQVNQTHTYKLSQQTVVRETVLDDKTEKPITTTAQTNLTLVRKWTVKAVDAAGVATLELTITQMKNEFRRPDGSSLVLDSANPEHAKEMAAYLNVPVVTIRVDSLGRLVEVKEAKAGSAARLTAELPFRLVLPESGPTAGQTWDRPFTLKLDPPLGTGETHEFAQKYTCTAIRDGLLILGVETSLKAPPKALAERVPLVPMLWTGEVFFNVAAGKYHAARLRVKAELPNFQGEGTRFEYESVYNEDAVDK